MPDQRLKAISTKDLPARMRAEDYLELVKAHPSLLRTSKPRGNGSRRNSEPRTEEDLHRQCFSWVLENEGKWPILKWMFHPANGGARSKGEGGKLKAMGVRPGVPDFILPMPHSTWSGLAVELKTVSGALSSTQEDWVGAFTEARYVVGVARTLNEFVELVYLFLGVDSKMVRIY